MNKNRKIIYLAGFVFSLSLALISYINSSFISSFIDEKLVGTIYALASFVSIFALLLIPKIFRRIGAYKFLLWAIGLNALSILLFSLSKNALNAIVFFILIFTFNILIYSSLDELLKISSRDSATGKIRGSYLTFCNLAWIIAQLAFGTILGGFSLRMIYLVSFVMMLLFFVISHSYLSDIRDPKYDQTTTKKYILEFFRNKNLFRAYGISFLLQFFYAWMVIYTPIYLSIHLGFSWKEIGIIFAIMLLPFIILDIPLGKFSDKIGERKMLMFGFTIASLATLSLFFIQIHAVWIWALLLFITRIGAANIEVMSEAYFFKHIKPEEEQFIQVSRSSSPVAYILGPLLAFVVFIFIPSFNLIYTILGIIMLFGVYLSSTIKKSDI